MCLYAQTEQSVLLSEIHQATLIPLHEQHFATIKNLFLSHGKISISKSTQLILNATIHSTNKMLQKSSLPLHTLILLNIGSLKSVLKVLFSFPIYPILQETVVNSQVLFNHAVKFQDQEKLLQKDGKLILLLAFQSLLEMKQETLFMQIFSELM